MFRRLTVSLLIALGLSCWATAHAETFPIAVAGSEGLRVIVGQTGQVVATYQGNSAWNNNTLYLALDAAGHSALDGNNANDLAIFNNKTTAIGTSVVLGNFQAGTELIFRLNTISWDNASVVRNFYSGDASRNADANAHARVQTNWLSGTTLVSFEDLYNGPFNYNDMSFSFTNTIAMLVPEGETGALSAAGLALLITTQRRRRRL